MSQELTSEGTFRGRIIQYGLQEASDVKSASLGIAIKVEIDEAYDFGAAAWIDWREHQCQCYGYVNLVKKDGTPNDVSAANLSKCTGWNGSLADVAIGDWKPEAIQFSTKADTYKDKTSYKVDFINPYDSTPGGTGIKSVDESKAKALQARYGSSFKAIAASTRNPAPSSSKPVAPPARPAPRNAPVSTTVDENGEVVVPF